MRIALAAFSLVVLAVAQAGMARPARTLKPVPPAVHKVRRGETAARIARAAGLTLEQLAALNPRINLSRLSAGTVLTLKAVRQAPAPVKAPEPVKVPEPAAAPAATVRMPGIPMPPLPGIHALAPAILIHLERLIPMSPVKP